MKLRSLKITFQFYNEVQRHRVRENCCDAGTDSVLIRANGDVFPCHLNKNRLFNIYKEQNSREPFKCDRKFCDCYLSYSNRVDLNINTYFGNYTPIRLPVKKDIEAVFLDVDGTITDESGKISEKAIESIRFLTDKVRIYLVTSLPLHIALKKCNPIKNYINGGVFANGGQIIDFNLNYNETITLKKEALEALADIPKIGFYKEKSSVYKVIAFKKKITSAIQSNSMLNVTYERDIANITSDEASKSKGILKICKLNSYDEDKIFVMGNSPNDLEIINYLKNSASVIDSNSKLLKKHARFILNIEHLTVFTK